MKNELLTAAQAATLLGVRTSTIYAYASRGLLGDTTRGPGRKALYPRELVETLRLRAAARSGHAPVAAAALRWGEPVLDTRITKLTPRGPVYRGRRAVDLVETPFERVAELLWGFEADWSQRLPRAKTKSPRPSLHATLEVTVAQLARLRSASVTALIHRLACAAGANEALAEREDSVAAALTASLLGRKPRAREVRLVNAALVLFADHELNASTFAARVAASAEASWPDCFIAAFGAATGLRHAGASNVAEAEWKRRDTTTLPKAGFDIGAYPGGDPRAQRLLELVRAEFPSKRLDAYLAEIERRFDRLPAIDFAVAVMSDALRFPPGASAVIFVIGRSAGWYAHILEQSNSDEPIRPRARYVEG